jgi:hypothetical protein
MTKALGKDFKNKKIKKVFAECHQWTLGKDFCKKIN